MRKIIKIPLISLLFVFSIAFSSENKNKDLDLAKKLAFLPGAGQFYNQKYIKGATLFLSEAYSLSQVAKFSKPVAGIVNIAKRNTFIWWAIAIYAYSVIDALIEAELSSFPDKDNILDEKED